MAYRFHLSRVKRVPKIWHETVGAVDPIPMQRATLDYLMHIVQGRNAIEVATSTELKEEKRNSLSFEEKNTIRYTAGYVLHKLKKQYSNKKSSMEIWQCILEMAEETELKHNINYSQTVGHGDGDFLSFTHAWIDYINRGRLYRVKDEVYLFFVELELCVYPLLHQQLTKRGHSKTKDEIIHQVKEDEDVLIAWTLLTVDLRLSSCWRR